MQLSIITPYYNTLEYIKKLRDVLEPQLTDKIEWIIIDDGCNEKRKTSSKYHWEYVQVVLLFVIL